MKTKALQNYMNGKDLATLSRQDEERYMQAMKEKEIYDQKSEDQTRLRIQNTQQNNKDALRK
jgi:hypothetical protein